MLRSGTRYRNSARFLACLFCVLLAAPALRANDSLEMLRSEFRAEVDPVRRARLFSKLGAALLGEMKKHEEAKEFDRVPSLFLEYRGAASAAYSGLTADGRDPQKHSAGFRELEIHLRKSLRQVADIVLGMPFDDRAALRKPQSDLEELDVRLVDALFPTSSPARKTPPSAPESHPHQ